jgi:hypothetical protein
MYTFAKKNAGEKIDGKNKCRRRRKKSINRGHHNIVVGLENG